MERVLRNTAATVSVTYYNGSSAVEADGNVTVVAKKPDGSTLFSTNATNDPAVGVYTTVIPAQSVLTQLTLSWTGSFSGTPVTIQTQVEIVGGFFFAIGELRAYEKQFQNTDKFPDDALVNARDEVEAEFEDICKRAFVPRYWHEDSLELDYDDWMIWLEKPEATKFIYIKQNNVDITSFYTNGYISRDKASPRALHVNSYGSNLFNYDTLYYPISADYEYGMTQVPIPIKQKALKRAKMVLLGQSSTIDERALTMILPDIGTVNLATPGQRGSQTGVPDIDVVLQRYTMGDGDGGAGVY